MNIRVDLDTSIYDGREVVFRSPEDCSQVTGLIVYYNGGTASQEFAFADAHGEDVGHIDHLFAADAVVKVILDLETSKAFVQNADTNAYLEGRFADIERAKGSAIICNPSGAFIGIADASNRKFDKFLIYGKTTQNGTPTPDAPVAIQSVSEIRLTGNNLLDGEAFADKVEKVANSPTTVYKDETAETLTIYYNSISKSIPFIENAFKENTQYTVVLYGKNLSGTSTNVAFIYGDGLTPTFTHFQFSSIKDEAGLSYSVYTSDAGRTLKSISVIKYGGTSVLHYNKCGVFEGKITKEDFEPYVGYAVTTPNLNGISGVCDEIDLASGKYVQRVGAVDLGDLYWNRRDELDCLYSASVPNKKPTNNTMCTSYPKLDYMTIFQSFPDKDKLIASFKDSAVIMLRDLNLTEDNIKTKLAGVKFYYELAEPIETELSTEELAQYAELRPIQPYTKIFNNGGADMELEYVADTKAYIDNKIAQLATAIVNNT